MVAKLGQIVYRLKQFIWAIRAELLPWQPPDLGDYLSPTQRAGFDRMPRTDQQHCATVWHKLREQGVTDYNLMQAALLHDVAKSDPRLTLFHRAIIVCLKAISPRSIERLAVNQPASWRYPFYLNLHHPEIGAELARQMQCPERTALLIHYHHADPVSVPDPTLLPWLEQLHQADDAS